MRNQDYDHEGMLDTLTVRLGEVQAMANHLYLIKDRITPGPNRPDALYKAEELEGDLSALSIDLHAVANRLESLRQYTMYPPAKYQRP